MSTIKSPSREPKGQTLFTAVAAALFVMDSGRFRDCVRTQGVVRSIEHYGRAPVSLVHVEHVIDGRPVDATMRCFSWPPPIHLRIPVLYDPDDPREVYPTAFIRRYYKPVMATAFAVIALMADISRFLRLKHVQRTQCSLDNLERLAMDRQGLEFPPGDG